MTESFWTFSVRVYGRADVAPACLALQNDYGLDVNLLLYCCWLGTHARRLDTGGLARALRFSEPWSEHVVRPLRHARAWMKQASEAHEHIPTEVYAELRESIKTIELEAERLEQLALEAMTADSRRNPIGPNDAAICASGNLSLYARETGIEPDAVVRRQLAIILSASTGVEAAQAIECLAAAGGSF